MDESKIFDFLDFNREKPIELFLPYGHVHNIYVALCRCCVDPSVPIESKLVYESLRKQIADQIIEELPEAAKYYLATGVSIESN